MKRNKKHEPTLPIPAETMAQVAARRMDKLLTILDKLITSQTDPTGEIRQLFDSFDEKDNISKRYMRYLEGAKNNSNVVLDPVDIVLFLHYTLRRNLTPRRLIDIGFITYNRAYRLSSWDMQYVDDFCHFHGLTELLETASTDAKWINIYPTVSVLNRKLGLASPLSLA